VFHHAYQLLAILIDIPREEIFHMIEQLRQILILFEYNERTLLYPGGNDKKDDVVAVIVIEVIRYELFTH
jgi:hypothetical protein